MNKIDKSIYDNFIPMPPDMRGWNSTNPIFEYLIKQTQPKTIIEVGTWKGASAINMGRVLKKENLQCTIHCVDTWLGAQEFWLSLKHTSERDLLLKNGYPQIYYQFLSNVVHNKLQDTIIPLPLPSSTAFKVLQSQQIQADLIYIDGSHEYEDALNDIANYKQLLTKDGVIFGDDYSKRWPGVVRAVSKSFDKKDITIIDNNFWVFNYKNK